jgi:hypothetical protein
LLRVDRAGAVVPGANGRIVFARCIAAPFKCFGSSGAAVWEIVAADPNDTNETVLAGPYPKDAWDDHFIANWSPDGKTVIFMANQGIWQVNADGSNLHLVWSPPPDGSGLDDGPAFTPDGKSIIFTRCCPKDSGYALWRINADGSGFTQLTFNAPGKGASSDPSWSPDGTKIIFRHCPSTGFCDLFTMNPDGSDVAQITKTAAGEYWP